MSTYEAFILGDVLVLTSKKEQAGIGSLIEIKDRKIQLDRCKLRVFDRGGNQVIPGVQLDYDSCVTMSIYSDKWF
jgi:hypothetical protein